MDEMPDPPEYRDPPMVTVPHFLLFQSVWYDNQHPERGIAVAGIHSHLEPPEGNLFPVRFSRFFVYFQMSGDVGDYRPHVRLVKIEFDDDNNVVEVQLDKGGRPADFHPETKRPFQISGFNYCEEFAYAIGPVAIAESGLYEFQLFLEGFEEPMARERVLAREYRDDEPFRENNDES